jgi:hypothetical protein
MIVLLSNRHLALEKYQNKLLLNAARTGQETAVDKALRLADRDVLTHAGSVSAETAKDHAEAAFVSWRAARRALPAPVDVDFEAAIRETKAIERQRPRGRKQKEDK